MLISLIAASESANEPAIARITAETTDGRKLGAEMLLTPLKVDSTMGDRFLGLFQSLGGDAFLGGRTIKRLRMGSLHPPAREGAEGDAPCRGERLSRINLAWRARR